MYESGDSNSVNTADQLHTCNWIRSHLEEHPDTCLPKQDVYETYRYVLMHAVVLALWISVKF